MRRLPRFGCQIYIGIEKMHGIKRVVVFCMLTMVLPTMLLIIPLYLKNSVYADVQFAVTESDIVEITDGISPIFCSAHHLKMNETFNAFQVSRRPEKTSYKKHIRLKKSMTLPDDTLEYWGFYLLKGAKVVLSVCSRFEGASILVVKGERNLRTCGMLDHNKNKARASGVFIPEAKQQVKVTFESNAQEINSKEQISRKAESHKNRLKQTSKKTQGTDANRTVSSMANTNSSVNSSSAEKEENSSDDSKELDAFFKTFEANVTKYTNDELSPGSENTTKSSDKARHQKSKQLKLQPENDDPNVESVIHRQKHRRNKETLKKIKEQMKQNLESKDGGDLEAENVGKEEDPEAAYARQKRSQEPIKPELLDRGIRHGGNAQNFADDDSSISSFENGLLQCYEGNVLLAHEFNSSRECMDVNYLLDGNQHTQANHNITEDGYFYYIFYSDNDIVSNDIHAVFDIYKPTLQYENVTKACINKTECIFPLPITSMDRVIVEVPTRDGIDHEIDDISVLVSVCVPRMGVYAIFPISVMFLILGCAFM
ncbi:uncharacterized protein LOC106635804 isoform X2 [Copidosoma floridanum]|uniref:uncharacterized protein LOC106635804 isoform X2 n=1 Tax=Copidosoma floridanum TaxID=29053 RepID=UPI0006C93FDB|nr:uncharacterized protein LOC106635804 isoform X2 [Copidosoma floridanum]